MMLFCCLPLVGCSIVTETHHVGYLAKRTTKLEPRLFRYLLSDKFAKLRNASEAKRVWASVTANCPDDAFSEHYRRGFLDGFADYLYRGGSGDPPLVPPREYWNAEYQTVGGKQAIQDWYNGFRHGSNECIAGGYRDLVVVPSSKGASADTPLRETPSDPSLLPVPMEVLDPPEPNTSAHLPNPFGPAQNVSLTSALIPEHWASPAPTAKPELLWITDQAPTIVRQQSSRHAPRAVR